MFQASNLTVTNVVLILYAIFVGYNPSKKMYNFIDFNG